MIQEQDLWYHALRWKNMLLMNLFSLKEGEKVSWNLFVNCESLMSTFLRYCLMVELCLMISACFLHYRIPLARMLRFTPRLC